MIQIAYIRTTRLLTDELVRSYMRSQQIQITRDFALIWGINAHCVFVPPGEHIPDGAWQVWLQDHSGDPDALGFHIDGGLPRSYVGIADALANETNWCVTCSHETLEMLLDPNINRTVVHDGYEFAMEVADAVEDDQFAYAVGGHHLTDFVTPAWFGEDQGSAPMPYSFRSNVSAPFALAEGGYIGRRAIPEGAWEMQMAPGMPTARMVKKSSSRTVRRFQTVSLNPTSDAPVG